VFLKNHAIVAGSAENAGGALSGFSSPAVETNKYDSFDESPKPVVYWQALLRNAKANKAPQ
jgi:hypothetical protein